MPTRLASPSAPLLVLIEDINRSNQPIQLVEKLQ
jgi:hypothetical protein